MELENQICTGCGKRKTSVAKVYLQKGQGKILINKYTFAEKKLSFQNLLEKIKLPLQILNIIDQYNINIYVRGGGIHSQVQAIQLAIANALNSLNPSYRHVLKSKGFLRSDSRIKERRKYGLKKARKASQYSKR